jgi:hypothetical protein
VIILEFYWIPFHPSIQVLQEMEIKARAFIQLVTNGDISGSEVKESRGQNLLSSCDSHTKIV